MPNADSTLAKSEARWSLCAIPRAPRKIDGTEVIPSRKKIDGTGAIPRVFLAVLDGRGAHETARCHINSREGG